MLKSDLNVLTLKSAAVIQAIFGLFLCLVPLLGLTGALFPETSALAYPFIGVFYLSLAMGLFIASFDPNQHWLIVLVGFLVKILTILVLVTPVLEGDFPLWLSLVLLVTEVLWPVPFYHILDSAYTFHTDEDSSPKKFNDLINYVRTNEGKTLSDLSQENRLLIVFIRQFGCIFCRENISELAKLKKYNDQKGLKLVFVHMSDHAFADEFFSKYFDHKVTHISDPGRFLYKAFGLKRGTFFQLFGASTWLRGAFIMLSKGIFQGKTEGDPLQLGGIFILHKGQVVYEQKTKRASELFELSSLPES